jgi:phage gp36-like protein
MYFTQDDLKKGIYPEVLQVIARVPENMDQAIEEAILEIASFLKARYDMTTEFLNTGNNRNMLVVKLIRDIALYNCYNISNPVNMPESRVLLYQQTIKYMRDIQSERADIPGLIRLDAKTGSNYVAFGGNLKRPNHY